MGIEHLALDAEQARAIAQLATARGWDVGSSKLSVFVADEFERLERVIRLAGRKLSVYTEDDAHLIVNRLLSEADKAERSER